MEVEEGEANIFDDEKITFNVPSFKEYHDLLEIKVEDVTNETWFIPTKINQVRVLLDEISHLIYHRDVLIAFRLLYLLENWLLYRLQ